MKYLILCKCYWINHHVTLDKINSYLKLKMYFIHKFYYDLVNNWYFSQLIYAKNFLHIIPTQLNGTVSYSHTFCHIFMRLFFVLFSRESILHKWWGIELFGEIKVDGFEFNGNTQWQHKDFIGLCIIYGFVQSYKVTT